MVEELLTYSPNDVKDLNLLMHELSSTSICNEEILNAIIKDENSHAYVIRDGGHIVSAGSLCIMHTLEFTIAGIESVVVSSLFRGRGYGKELVEHIVAEAKRLGVRSIHLTSNPKRVAANNLYRAMGFVQYETNCYVYGL